MPNISDFYLLVGILVMSGVTFLTRITPVILPKRWLDSPLLLAVNKGLPLAVMSLLILTSLSWYNEQQHFTLSPLLFAQILALIIVLISYHYWKQLFLSMIIGIASLNGLLFLLKMF
jgi:branched-subunit amino acid transport protein AzlD